MRPEKLTNISLLPDWQLLQWFHPAFYEEYLVEAVVLPDVCPAGIMPNGTVAVLRKSWLESFPFREVIGDIGCAMSHAVLSEFSDWNSLRVAWNELYLKLKGLNKTILGSGNHFIDGCLNQQGQLVILVHLGSRMTTQEKLDFDYRRDYLHYWQRAVENHREIWECIRQSFGRVEQYEWLSHDTVEEDDSFMVVRKGVTHSQAGQPILIASSFEDMITLGKARPEVARLKHSMSHGTGRQRSRGEAKAVEFDQAALRERIIIPDGLENASWRLEAPLHYRSSQEVLAVVGEFIEITDQLLPVAFMGGF
jgi:hypothetical protein